MWLRQPSCFATATAIALVTAWLSLAGCAEPLPSAPRDAPNLAADAEAALRALGADRFDVLDFRAEPPRDFTFVDDNEWVVRLRGVPFVAHARFTRDIHVRDPIELRERVGAPDWTPEESLAGEVLLDALGPGRRPAGQIDEVRSLAVFEDLGAAYRFRTFDRSR